MPKKTVVKKVLVVDDSIITLTLEKELLERKGTEEALRHSELWLDRIFHSLEEVVLVVTPDRAIVRINEAGQKIFGYDEEDLAGLPTEVLHVDHEHYVRFGERIAEAFASGKNANFEFRSRRKNGEIFPSRHNVSLLKDPLGKPMGIVSVVQDLAEQEMDVTRRMQAEKVLKQHKKDLERAQQVARIGSWTYDPKTQLPTWSDEMFRIFGMAPGTEAPSYEEHRAMIHPEDWDRFDAAVSSAITNGTGYNLEIRIICPNGRGSVCQCHLRAKPHRTRGGYKTCWNDSGYPQKKNDGRGPQGKRKKVSKSRKGGEFRPLDQRFNDRKGVLVSPGIPNFRGDAG